MCEILPIMLCCTVQFFADYIQIILRSSLIFIVNSLFACKIALLIGKCVKHRLQMLVKTEKIDMRY